VADTAAVKEEKDRSIPVLVITNAPLDAEIEQIQQRQPSGLVLFDGRPMRTA
jgi:hypothetical protein